MIKKLCAFILIAGMLITSFPSAAAETGDARWDALISHVDSMLAYARYNENFAYPQMFTGSINADTKEPVEWKSDGRNYYPANFFGQQNFIRTLVAISEITGDDKYRNIANEQIDLWLENGDYIDNNGLIYAGAHAFVDTKSGQIITTGTHETKDSRPFIEYMYEVQPEKTKKYLEAFWNAHILDWSNLAMSRHGEFNEEWSLNDWNNEYTDTSVDFKNENEDIDNGLAFMCTGNDLIYSAFFLTEKTGDPRPAEWGKRMLKKYMDLVNPSTGLSGAQYGEASERNGGDRAQAQFGNDPLLKDIAYERNYINSNGLLTLLGYGPQVFLKYAEEHPEDAFSEEIVDYVVNAFKGFKNHVYEFEYNEETGKYSHYTKTPMFSDGTSMRGYTLTTSGYYGKAGNKLPEKEYVEPLIFRSAVYAYKLSGDPEIWSLVRDMAKGFGMGEIGTEPGENVSLTEGYSDIQTYHVLTFLDLYKETGCEDYLTIAQNIGTAMAKGRTRNGMFSDKARANASLDISFILALVNIKAAEEGKYDTGLITNTLSHSPIDMYYDGVGRVQNVTVIDQENYQEPGEIDILEENVTLALPFHVSSDDEKLSKVQGMGAFTQNSPDDRITVEDYVDALAVICGENSGADLSEKLKSHFNDKGMTAMLEQDTAWFTREKAGALAAAVLIMQNGDVVQGNNFLHKYIDGVNNDDGIKDVSQSIFKYVEAAASLHLIGEKGAEMLYPNEQFCASQAAKVLLDFAEHIDTSVFRLETKLFLPENPKNPYRVTNTVVEYSSDDESVVRVDSKGRLYPVGEGTAQITANCCGKTDTCTVEVKSASTDEIRDIWINGERLNDYSVYNNYYNVLLPMDTQKAEIRARTYGGNDISVKSPYKLPGTAIVDSKYHVYMDIDNSGVYHDDEFEDYGKGTAMTGVKKDKITWVIGSNGHSTGIATVVTAEDPENPENTVLKIPYENQLMEVRARFGDYPISVGADADEGKIVLEYSMKTKNMLSSHSPINVRLGQYRNSSDATWATRIDYKFENGEMFLYNNKGAKKIGTIQKNASGYYSADYKMVLNKKTLNFDFYVNGECVGQGLLPGASPDSVNAVMIHIPEGGGINGAEVLVDNIKIYEIPSEDASKVDFFKEDNQKVSYICSGDTVKAKVKLMPGAIPENVVSYIGYHLADGTLKNAFLDNNPEINNNEYTLNIDTSNLVAGDYIIVRSWNGMTPVAESGHIYVRNSLVN